MNRLPYAVIVVSLMLLNFGLWGCQEEKAGPVSAVAVSAPTTKPAEVVAEQKVCPISDHDIDPKVFVLHEGKKVYFCCEACQKPFQDQPQKYVTKLPQFGGKESESKGKM